MALDEAAWGRFIALFEDDMDGARELVAMFIGESQKLGDRVADAIAAGDAEGFRRASHSLKSTSLQLGGQALSVTCQAIEDAGRDGDVAAAAARLAEFKQQVRTLHTDLAERVRL